MGVSSVRLSHLRALACLAQDKQLESAHAIYYTPSYAHHGLAMMCRGHNTPVDVSGCASSELIDLRDLQVEENVRKRPFFYKINPMPVWAIELYAKVQKKSEIANFNKRKY